MANARMSYIGRCQVEGILIPTTSMNSAIENNISFYEHTVGLQDTNFTGDQTKGPNPNPDLSGGYNQIQRKIFRYSPSIVKGKMSGPISSNDTTINVKNLIEHAIKGTEITTMDFIYFSSPSGSGTNEGHQMLNSLIESLTINISSGEVANFDANIISKSMVDTPSFTTQSSVCSKLLTWDKCSIISSLVGDIQNFSIVIKNNVIPIYVSGSTVPTNNYYGPYALRLGMQEVTGTIGTYGFNTWNNANADILTFKLGNNEWKLNIRYNPTASNATGSNEPYVSSTPYTGVADTPVWISST